MTERRDDERCAVCTKDASDGRYFCHFYDEHGRLTFCSPECADTYLQREPGKLNGHAASFAGTERRTFTLVW